MGKTADLIRDRAALDRLPGSQREASWVVCRSATVPPRRQETVPMARSDAVTLLDVMQVVRAAASNEQETLATVVHLISSGQVRLSDEAIRAFRDLFAPTPAAA
jgi:hypothetical protein